MAKPDSNVAHMALTMGSDSMILTDASVDTVQQEFSAPTTGHFAGKTIPAMVTKAEFSFYLAALEGAADVSDWIAQFIKTRMSELKSDLAFSALDAKYEVTSRVELLEAQITEVRFPAFDAASKDPIKLTVKLSGKAKWLKGEGELIRGTRANKNLMSSNFRVEIGGLPTEHVTKLDSMIFTRGGCPDLALTVATKDIDPFNEWFTARVIKGSRASSSGTQGSLEVLDASLLKPKFELQFFELLPIALRLGSLVFEVRVSSGRMSFKRN